MEEEKGTGERDLEILRKSLKEKRNKVSEQVRKHPKEVYLPIGIAVLLSVSMSVFSSIDFQMDTGPEIEGETVDIVVDSEGAEPFRPEISEEDGVRFINNASYKLNFTFDREVGSCVIEEGESKVVDVNSIIYFYVDSADESANFREIKGGVNVQ